MFTGSTNGLIVVKVQSCIESGSLLFISHVSMRCDVIANQIQSSAWCIFGHIVCNTSFPTLIIAHEMTHSNWRT